MTQKKLILFMPSIEGGGVEKNFFLISNFLAKRIGKTILITAEKNLTKKLRNVNILSPKSSFWRNNGRLRKYLICVLLLIKFLVKNRKEYFVFSFQANIYAILICKLLRVKIISRSNSSPSGWSKSYIKNIIYKFGLNLADVLVVNSIEFKNEMMKKFSVNSFHIYNPLNKDEIIKLSKKRIINPFSKGTLKIINVGRLVDQKGQLILLKALNNIKNIYKFELVLIGRGKEYKKIKEFIKFNKLSKVVKIFYTNNPYPYIKKADLFILSSKFEGLPNVLLESLALKKFIISSNCPTGPKEILINGKGGLLFKTGDYKDLSKKIIFYTKNKKKCIKMKNLAIKNLYRFDYKKNLNQYLKLTKKII